MPAPPAPTPPTPTPPTGPVRGPGQLLAELRASRAYLAASVSRGRWLSLGQFRWRDLALGQGARASLGVLTPLALGIATRHSSYGTYAALGALPAGFVSFRGVTTTRVLAVAAAAAGMAVSTFVGATTSASQPWLLVPVVMIWAYVTGLIAALGPTATAVALQGPVALLIASALPLSPAQAAVRACLVLAGGLWQGALVASSWALSRGSGERTALAGSYQILSRYAAQLTDGQPGPPPAAVLPGTEVLKDPNPLLRSVARMHLLDLAAETERLRSSLTALGSAAAHRSPDGTSATDPAARALLAASAQLLGAIADALSSRTAERGPQASRIQQDISAMHLPVTAPWRWAGEALLGQLRSTARMLQRLDIAEPVRSGRQLPERQSGKQARRDAIQATLLTLRANLGTSSEAGRHALRLAAVTGATEALVRASGLPHGYWAVLTIFIVLRPDYSSTLYRGLQRAAGTVLGAGLGVATVLLARAGTGFLLAGIAVSLVAAYSVFAVNYLLYAVFLTDFVVILLAMLGLPADSTALDRLVGTGVGTGLALLAYVLWPTWEGSLANEKFERLFEAQGSYASALLRAYSRPAGPAAADLRGLKLTARRARSDAEASADRLADEPAMRPMTAELAQGLTSAGHRLAQSALTLDAAVALHHKSIRSRPEPSVPGGGAAVARGGGGAVARGGGGAGAPQDSRSAAAPKDGRSGAAGPDTRSQDLDRLADGLTLATQELARSLRTMQPPGDLPPLRQLQSAVAREADPEANILVAATDGLADATNTAADTLRRHLSRVDRH